jgi:hypothetical protein
MQSSPSRLILAAAAFGLFAAAPLSVAAASPRHHHDHHHHWLGHDTVGSIHYGGRGYGYNRVSGQPYQKCMEDLGYGRTEPCDGGGNR